MSARRIDEAWLTLGTFVVLLLVAVFLLGVLIGAWVW